MSPLRGKILILTGASEGIGAALVTALRARGATLILVARNEARLRENATPHDLVLAGDLTDEAFRVKLVDLATTRFGKIDGLINNAGRGSYFSSLETPLAEARALFELNFFAPFHLTQLVAQHIRATRGTIVNVSSIAGQIPLPGCPSTRQASLRWHPSRPPKGWNYGATGFT